ncbi:hypothetical protein RN001_012789 [Aquatica leii]|uniref:Tetraspanin n=1 Tax=Aquatica leii TaxID=1421715 RepID=A0AAN7PUT0_9COLE|nr:hypothetical protein RN001_012789 [Aquatica leii]
MKNLFGENCLRVALVAFNFIFAILSVALIALSVIYSDKLSSVKLYVDELFINFPTLVLVLGILSFILSMFGCFCARSTNRRFFIVFLAVLFCILALELTVTVIAFSNIDSEVIETTSSIMIEQVTALNLTQEENFHQIEELFQCCGINNASDYVQHNWLNTSFCCGVKNCQDEIQNNNESVIWNRSGCAFTVGNSIYQVSLEGAIIGTVYSSLQVLENICVFIMQGRLKF